MAKTSVMMKEMPTTAKATHFFLSCNNRK